MTITIVGPGIPDDFNQTPEIAKSRDESSTSVENVVRGCKCRCAKSRLTREPSDGVMRCFRCPCKCGGRGCWDGMVATPVLTWAPSIFRREAYAEIIKLIEPSAQHQSPCTGEGSTTA